MNTSADAIGRDPSWMTTVVDGLESRGLATRRATPGDRRVKVVEVTESGRAPRTELINRAFARATKLVGAGTGRVVAVARPVERDMR